MPEVTIYITTFNYGKYLEKAVQSVLDQNSSNFELIIIDDASTDQTPKILTKFQKHDKITIIRNKKNIGLIKSASRAIALANGKYIMRLDGDDYLDENALLLMTNILNKHSEIGLIYPDYFQIDEKGNILDHIRRKKIDTEVKLLDLPAHGACTMIRKSCYDKIGGYNQKLKCQDGYDLWLKFIDQFKPYNINLPLFFYRQHEKSLTKKTQKILDTRKHIKKNFIKQKYKNKLPKILAIIPAKATSYIYPNFPLKKLAGQPLIYYPIKAIQNCSLITKSIFVSENPSLLKKAAHYNIKTLKRPNKLAEKDIGLEATINYVINHFEKKEKFYPDIIVQSFITSPLLSSENITEAINTLLIYNADSVIAVRENKKILYRHAKYGLEPIYKKRLLKHEKDLIYEETGSLLVTRREFVTNHNIIGKKISHVILNEIEAIDIDNEYQFWLVEQVLKHKPTLKKLWK